MLTLKVRSTTYVCYFRMKCYVNFKGKIYYLCLLFQDEMYVNFKGKIYYLCLLFQDEKHPNV